MWYRPDWITLQFELHGMCEPRIRTLQRRVPYAAHLVLSKFVPPRPIPPIYVGWLGGAGRRTPRKLFGLAPGGYPLNDFGIRAGIAAVRNDGAQPYNTGQTALSTTSYHTRHKIV